MDDLLKLLGAGNTVTVPGLLLTQLVVVVIALYREWIVLGKPYRKCMERVAAFEEAATKRAEASEDKVARLESELADLRDRAGRRR